MLGVYFILFILLLVLHTELNNNLIHFHFFINYYDKLQTIYNLNIHLKIYFSYVSIGLNSTINLIKYEYYTYNNNY